ncbi:tetratricopeptide repeat protein [Chroococcidiopsis sp. FACHB-1243]|uniref:tetratricopeptide repeat protein n=1 Tax=Chroococcidiopsis sp. [FACHB-1243] TaxID=2692781 RepID=UPI00177BE074|nr:tetratricopeptide repeat protein [Chroococcidiopsis sp. [FACHB-1243]]MBD2305840.1 tetratricopeptide repeat protein [Chroococcidiopsis sp. [FACHB-1243]]
MYRVVIICCVTFAVLLFPLNAQAQPAANTLEMHNHQTKSRSVEDLFKRGVYQTLVGKYRTAIADFSQVILLQPNNATAYANRGLARAAKGDRQDALKDFDRALSLNPDSAIAYYNRGFTLSKLEDYHGAIADFDRAIRIDPEDPSAYHCRCLVRYKLGDMVGVAEDLRTVAQMYLQRGKFDAYTSLLAELKSLHELSHPKRERSSDRAVISYRRGGFSQ